MQEFCDYFSISCTPVHNHEFHNFDDWDYWYSYPDEEKGLPDYRDKPRYTRDSCVGQLFINKTTNVTLRKKGTIEINPQSSEHQMVHQDPKGAKGIMVGDFLINKNDAGEDVQRENLMEEPKIKTDDGAF